MKYLPQKINNSIVYSLLSTLIIIIIYFFYYADLLGYGSLKHIDEYLTLDRTFGFLYHNDFFTVYESGNPSFKKPPLQYWLTTIPLQLNLDLELSLRVWSFIFGLFLLATTGWLAYELNNKENPFVIPIATLILSGSSLFWELSLSAMLDSGAALFFTLSITALLIAFKIPKAWYAVGVVVVIGALQKAPIGFAVISIYLIFLFISRKYHNVEIINIIKNYHFKNAAKLTFFLLLIWPAIQIFQYGPMFIKTTYQQQIKRFSPLSNHTRTNEIGDFFLWLFNDNHLIWLLAIVSLFLLPKLLNKSKNSYVPIFIFSVFFIVITMAKDQVYNRYLLSVLPFLAASLAINICHFIPFSPINLLSLIVIIGSLGNTPNSSIVKKNMISNQVRFIPMMQRFANNKSENESLIACRWQPEEKKDKYSGIFLPTISFYAGRGQPFNIIKSVDHFKEIESEHKLRGPYRGICHTKAFLELKPYLKNISIIENKNNYIVWLSN